MRRSLNRCLASATALVMAACGTAPATNDGAPSDTAVTDVVDARASDVTDANTAVDAEPDASPLDVPVAQDAPHASDAPVDVAPDATHDAAPADGGCGLTTILDGFVPTRHLYVDATHGSDSNDGLTTGTAWRTMANVARVRAGDEVDIAPGTYPCNVYINALYGTAAQPIWFRASGGARTAVFACGGSTVGWELAHVRYVAIDGLDISGPMQDTLHIHSGGLPYTDLSDHVLVIHNHLHNAGGACLKVNSATNIDVFANELDHAQSMGSSLSGQAVDFVGVHSTRIVGNDVHDVMGTAATGIQTKGGAMDTLIDGNRLWNLSDAIHLGGATGSQYFLPTTADYEGLGVVASNNVICGATNVALSAIGCRDCVMANNSVAITAAQQPVRMLDGSTATGAVSHTSGLLLVNNALDFITTRPMDMINASAADTAGFMQSHNLWFWSGSMPYTDVPLGGPGLVTGVDPMFTNPTATPCDLRPRAGSAVIGAGVPVTGVTRTADGTCRTTWNIGAY